MTFNVAHWDIRNGIFGIIVYMHEDDIIEHTNGKYHIFTLWYARDEILEHINAKCYLYTH